MDDASRTLTRLMTTSKVGDYVRRSRGEVIDRSIHIEAILTNIITWCFYPSQHTKCSDFPETIDANGLALKSLLLRRIDFRDKIEVLKEAILFSKPEVMKANKPLITTIVKELNRVRGFRNLLAHSESDLSWEFVNESVSRDNNTPVDRLQVIEYRKGVAIKHLITKAKYVSETKTMTRVQIRLWQLCALLNDDYEQARKIGTWIAPDSS